MPCCAVCEIQRYIQGVSIQSNRDTERRRESPPVADDGRGQDGRSLWRRQSGTGGRAVESVRPRSASCPRLSPIAFLRRLGINVKLLANTVNDDPERLAPKGLLGELKYLDNGGSAIASISDDLRRDPSTSDGSHVRDVEFRDIRFRPSTSTTTTMRTALGTPDDIQTTPSHGRRSPPSPAVPFLSPCPLISAGRRVAGRRQIVVPLVPMPSARRREGPSQRRRHGPPHVDVVPRHPALRHRRSRVALQRSRVRSTPFPPPVVVANHATATFAFDDGLLYVLNDASDIARLDALNALVALLARLAIARIQHRRPLDDVADAFNVALLDELDAAVALCVAALIERRRMRRRRRTRSSATTRQHVGDDETARGRRRPGKTSSTS
ncbi:hypothetical protein EV122DRAFT_285331 [Schizophyllum commune]